MKPKWLLEKDTFAENLEGIYNAIKSQGMEYKVVDYFPFEGMKFADTFGTESQDCIITYGSLGMSKQVLKKTRWVPGAWCDLKKFECTYYYPRLGKYLLNNHYMMLPYGELVRQYGLLADTFGRNDSLFIRPNGGDKSFSGKVISCGRAEQYIKDVQDLGFYGIEPESLVAVSRPINLFEEWRLVIVEGQCVASSQYKENGLVKLREGCPLEVLKFAFEVVSTWQPERCWVLDICRTKARDFRVVEINSFSSSGLYVCNKDDVVRAVSAAAVNEWEEYQSDEVQQGIDTESLPS